MDTRIRTILEHWFGWSEVHYYQNPNVLSDLWEHTGWYGYKEGLLYHKGDFFTNDVAAIELLKCEKWPEYWYICKHNADKNGIYYQVRDCRFINVILISNGTTLAEALSLAVLKRIERSQLYQENL